MNTVVKAVASTVHLLSGNESVARAVWEAGVSLATAYPGTPSTEILENVALYPDIRGQWSVNEKVALEVAIGASVMGTRAFCAMKHVGMNVASDALMSQTLAGVGGGLVIAVADDVGLSSSQNEQDSRFWGRFGHLPILEPADSQEAYDMTKQAFDISEQFGLPVILRLTTRICHVKTVVTVGERTPFEPLGFQSDPAHWVMVPAHARGRLSIQVERDKELAAFAETTDLTVEHAGTDKRVGFVTSGPAFLHVIESFPDSPILKLGFTCPVPIEKIRAFAKTVDAVVVVEETEPLIESELKAAGVAVHGKDILPRTGELTPDVIIAPIRKFMGDTVDENDIADAKVFPRPPTMCVGCPHLPVYYSLSRLRRKIRIAGDIGCYTLGAGQPWKALDTTTCMGSSVTMAQGMAATLNGEDAGKAVVAVIGDSTFLHMGMNGLADLCYNGGNVTLLLLDNSATGMTGGQENPGTGRNIHGEEAATRVDFRALVEALGVRKERVHVINPYELPKLYGTIKDEITRDEPSVIITNQPCVLIDSFEKFRPLAVVEDDCTGCANCLNVGCPAIEVTRREVEVRKNGKEVSKAWVRIDSAACTGCDLCPKTCGPNAIVPYQLNMA